MRRVFQSVILVVCMTVAGAPVAAQDGARGYCDRGQLSSERLVGNWTLYVSQFRITNPQGVGAYVGRAGELPVSIDWENGAFVLRGIPNIPPVRLVPVGPNEPKWRWSADPKMTAPRDPDSGLSSEDFELVYDCEIERFPRYVGTFQTMSTDGTTPVNQRIGVIAFEDGLLVGFWTFTAGAGAAQAKRTGYIQLTR